jgi:hypothetical protein
MSDLYSITVTRDEWAELPDSYKAGIALDARWPITERDYACHAHYLLNGSAAQADSVEVATPAPYEVVIRIGNADPSKALAAAHVLEDEWDRQMLPIGLRLSFEPRR